MSSCPAPTWSWCSVNGRICSRLTDLFQEVSNKQWDQSLTLIQDVHYHDVTQGLPKGYDSVLNAKLDLLGHLYRFSTDDIVHLIPDVVISDRARIPECTDRSDDSHIADTAIPSATSPNRNTSLLRDASYFCLPTLLV